LVWLKSLVGKEIKFFIFFEIWLIDPCAFARFANDE